MQQRFKHIATLILRAVTGASPATSWAVNYNSQSELGREFDRSMEGARD